MQENLTDVDWTFYPWCLQLLTNHYEQNWKYYCLPSGMGSFGTASEEELLLTKKLFWGIFDSLSHKVPQGFFVFFFLTPTGSVEKSWGGKRSVKFPWAELLRQISPDESFISLWQATSLRHFLRSCRLPLSSSWLLDCVHPIPELQMKPFFRPAVPFVCVFAEVWCWTFQNGHSMPVCHRGSPPPWLCGCQFGSNAGETGVPGCTGQLWPQTHQYCQVSSVRSVTLTLTNL